MAAETAATAVERERIAQSAIVSLSKAGAKKLAHLSPWLGILAGSVIALQAGDAYAQGRTDEAKHLIEDFAAELAGSTAGQVAAGALAAAGLVLAGVALATPVGMATILIASVAGGYFGGDWGKEIAYLFQDRTEEQSRDLADRMLKLLFGDDYNLNSAIPQELKSGALTIDSTIGRDQMVKAAKEDIAWRYALRELNPFVIFGDSLYAQHNTDGSLDLYDPVADQGSMTELYLQDRAAMLTWRLRYDIDKKPYTSQYSTDEINGNWDFVDVKSGMTLQIDGQGVSVYDHQIVFGTKSNDTIEGSGDFDHLYGMAGNDTISGEGGDDYLEGNAGNDNLDGGDGIDILFGGKGDDTLKGGAGVDLLLGGGDNDTLDGGAGSDLLQGGAGNDIYVFTGDYGTDIITDSDGNGGITVDDQPLGGAAQTFDSVYKDEASGHIFVQLNGGKNLVVLKEDSKNRILVNDWLASGALGIALQDKAAEVPVATLTGGFKKLIDLGDPASLDDDVYKIVKGNYVSDGDDANAPDMINGSGGDDVIDGGAGDDALTGHDGDDYIIGGLGGDMIQGGKGKDTLIGGAGDDLIYGSSDADILMPSSLKNYTPPVNDFSHPMGTGFNWYSGYYDTIADGVPLSYSNSPRDRLDDDKENVIDGGIGNDFIAAGTGADIVHGGENNDFIFGMDKGDILFGDAGNDLIYGDGNQPGDNSVVWALYENHGNDVIDGGSGNDYLYGQGGSDIVFGGIGNDKIWGDENEADLPAEHHGDDFLFGGAETDELYGGGGNDYLEGGTGSDKIWGGTGDDVYFFNAGDGVDELYDNKGERNIIRFGEGFDASKIKLKLGSLMLDLGNGDAIHIEDFDRDDVFSSSSITSFEFFDGSTLSLAELLERGFDLEGTDVNETIYGTNANDRIDGKGGTDVLIGGAGDDTYIFHVGDSPVAQQDGRQALEWVDDSAGQDTVALIDVDPSSIHVRMMLVSDSQPAQLVVQYGTTDQLLLKDGADGRIEHFQVVGETLSLGEFVGRYADSAISGVNENGQTLLNGGRSDDYLTTSQSNAVVSGGRGNDTLRVTGNDSTVLYSLGDGRDEVETGGTGNVLRLGEGILLGDIKVLSVYQNTLTLQVGNAADDILRFSSFNLDDPFTTRPFDTIEFADGTSFDFAEFIAQGFTLIGTDGIDLVSGLTGDDDLDGGAGNDVLRGGSGGDTYRFGLGSGHDTIDDRGNNPYDINRLVLGAGLTPDNLQFIHHGNDLIVRTGDGNDQVNILDHYAGHGVGAIAFNDGSMWSEADIDAHALDMFTLGTQQAAVTVVETSPLGAIVQLSAGLAFSDIVATQSGNDLLLQVRGTQSSLRLQNYYDTNPTLWAVVDSLGAQSTMANLVDATIAAEANYVTSLQQDFLSWSRLGIAQQLADSGYTQNTDGSWYKTTSWVSAGNNKTVSDQTVTTQYTWYNGWAPSTTIQTNQTETWAVSGFYSSFGLGVETATVEHISLAGVDEIIGVETFEASQTTRQALADIHWVLESSRTLPSSQYSSSGPIYGNYGATVVGRSTSSTVTQNVEYQYAAYLDRPLSESSVQIVDNAYVSGYLPNKLPGTVDINSYIYRVAEINLTDGNHTVYADLNTLVVAGSGDNTIYNAGFAYGGVGNSSLIGGHILVAGQGNQTLEGGDIMVVGDGHDSVVANAGNTIEINPDNAEMDLVTSNANQSIEVADLYYRALGIDDWQERYQYGGQFRCDNDGEDIYLESAQDVLEFYQGWTSDPLSIQGLIDWGWVAKVQPLEDLVDFAGLNANCTKSAYYEQHRVSERQITATDFSFLDPYYESGQLISTLVKFGEGLSLSDLEFSWSQSESPSDSRLHAVLNLGWGSDQGIQIIMPNSSDAIGRGAYRFEFADGSSLSLGEMMALAPPAPDFNPDLLLFGQGAGQLSISPWAYRGIRMAAGLSPADLSLGQDGVDLVITSDATNDVLRIQNWYQSPDYQQYYPDLIFDDATRWSPTMLSRMATVVDGSAGGLTLSGLEGFATTLIAGTGDTLIGTHWGDVYVYGQGIGEIHIQDSQGGTVRFGAGITPEMLTLDPNEMVIKVGDSGDKIYLDNVDPLLAGSGISVQGFEFADGSTLSYDQLTHRGWDIWGSSVNDVLKGTAIDDRMYGDAGDDTLQGGDGQDLLVGGTGNDLLDGGAGANTYVFNLGKLCKSERRAA